MLRVLFLITILLTFVGVSFTQSTLGTATTEQNINIRATASTSAGVVDVLSQDEKANILSEVQGQSLSIGGTTSDIWYEIEVNGLTGFVWSGLVIVETVEEPPETETGSNNTADQPNIESSATEEDETVDLDDGVANGEHEAAMVAEYVSSFPNHEIDYSNGLQVGGAVSPAWRELVESRISGDIYQTRHIPDFYPGIPLASTFNMRIMSEDAGNAEGKKIVGFYGISVDHTALIDRGGGVYEWMFRTISDKGEIVTLWANFAINSDVRAITLDTNESISTLIDLDDESQTFSNIVRQGNFMSIGRQKGFFENIDPGDRGLLLIPIYADGNNDDAIEEIGRVISGDSYQIKPNGRLRASIHLQSGAAFIFQDSADDPNVGNSVVVQ